jgi:hypothetical protein
MKKSQNTSFMAQENRFGPAFSHKILRLVKGTAKPNKYDLPAMQSVKG